ncbi:MAG: dephospho-CoA kinase [Dehalococcoidales bacterium]|nr:MAG: dephospho-CoA kinase [Dehalococcoidales bacterium]
MTKVIGLTGGIGSGKSTVSGFLKELGAVVIDADKVGHEVFLPDTPAWHDVTAAFGQDIIAPSGEIDRKKLGEIVFNDPEALSRLNRIMHPRMYDMMQAQIEEYRRDGIAVVVVEAAILIEANWQSLVDEIWVTITPEDTVIRRLKEQRGLDEEQTKARIRSQLANDDRVKHADVVIDNNGNLDEIRAKVNGLWDKLVE